MTKVVNYKRLNLLFITNFVISIAYDQVTLSIDSFST